jgi:hypothetical protein
MEDSRYYRNTLREFNYNQHDDGMKARMIGGGRVREYIVSGDAVQSAYAVGGCMCEDMEGSGSKGGKTAKFLRSVGHFVKPAAPLVKKAKKALAPLAKEAINQGMMEMAYGGGKGGSPWIQHVKAFASEHGISYKEALSRAKATYKR